MSAVTSARPFVTTIRSRPEIVRVGEGGARITVRVELLEQYDTVAFDIAADAPALALKLAALAAFGLADAPATEFVMKLRGVEIVHEQESLAAAGTRDGSSFLLAYRSRRPVR